MILDHDAVKEKYLYLGYPYKKACGKALKDISEILRAWRGNILCFFGPPGCGKSRFIARLIPSPDTLIFETSGINIGINRVLHSLDNVEYCMIATPPHTCIQNVMNRPYRALDSANSLDNLVSLIQKFFDLYDSDWDYKLPADRTITVS